MIKLSQQKVGGGVSKVAREYTYNDFNEDLFSGTAGAVGGGLAANTSTKYLTGHSALDWASSTGRKRVADILKHLPDDANALQYTRKLFDKGALRNAGKWAIPLSALGLIAAPALGGTLAAGEMRQSVQSQRERGERYKK